MRVGGGETDSGVVTQPHPRSGTIISLDVQVLLSCLIHSAGLVVSCWFSFRGPLFFPFCLRPSPKSNRQVHLPVEPHCRPSFSEKLNGLRSNLFPQVNGLRWEHTTHLSFNSFKLGNFPLMSTCRLLSLSFFLNYLKIFHLICFIMNISVYCI